MGIGSIRLLLTVTRLYSRSSGSSSSGGVVLGLAVITRGIQAVFSAARTSRDFSENNLQPGSPCDYHEPKRHSTSHLQVVTSLTFRNVSPIHMTKNKSCRVRKIGDLYDEGGASLFDHEYCHCVPVQQKSKNSSSTHGPGTGACHFRSPVAGTVVLYEKFEYGTVQYSTVLRKNSISHKHG